MESYSSSSAAFSYCVSRTHEKAVGRFSFLSITSDGENLSSQSRFKKSAVCTEKAALSDSAATSRVFLQNLYTISRASRGLIPVNSDTKNLSSRASSGRLSIFSINFSSESLSASVLSCCGGFSYFKPGRIWRTALTVKSICFALSVIVGFINQNYIAVPTHYFRYERARAYVAEFISRPNIYF